MSIVVGGTAGILMVGAGRAGTAAALPGGVVWAGEDPAAGWAGPIRDHASMWLRSPIIGHRHHAGAFIGPIATTAEAGLCLRQRIATARPCADTGHSHDHSAA